MKRFILTSVALAFAVVLGSTTNLEAAPHKGGGHVASHGHVAAHTGHASFVAHRPVNFTFRARGYRGWASRCWFPSYRCYGYYCGADQLWYYWYAPLNQYLPITYMSVYPPTVGIAPVGVAPVGMPVMSPTSPALPPGASFVPGPITTP